MYIYHGRSCLRDRGGARPPWRTKILILHIFSRNKLGLEEQGLLIAAPLKEVVRFAYDIYLILL